MVESVLQAAAEEATAATLGSCLQAQGNQSRRGQALSSGYSTPASVDAPASPLRHGGGGIRQRLQLAAGRRAGDDMSEMERLLQGIDVPANQAAKTSVRNYSLSRSNAHELAA